MSYTFVKKMKHEFHCRFLNMFPSAFTLFISHLAKTTTSGRSKSKITVSSPLYQMIRTKRLEFRALSSRYARVRIIRRLASRDPQGFLSGVMEGNGERARNRGQSLRHGALRVLWAFSVQTPRGVRCEIAVRRSSHGGTGKPVFRV